MTYEKFIEEAEISISQTEANNAINTAIKFVDIVKEIIKKENPQKEFKF